MKYILAEILVKTRFLIFPNMPILRRLLRFLLPIFILLLVANISTAQMIDIQRGPGGNRYFQNGEKQSFKDLTNIMESDSLEYAFISSARSWHTVSALTAGAGSILVIISVIKGTNESFIYAAAGAGMILAIIPFSIIGTRETIRAIDLYNLKYKSFGMQKPKSYFAFSANSSGVGICFIF